MKDTGSGSLRHCGNERRSGSGAAGSSIRARAISSASRRRVVVFPGAGIAQKRETRRLAYQGEDILEPLCVGCSRLRLRLGWSVGIEQEELGIQVPYADKAGDHRRAILAPLTEFGIEGHVLTHTTSTLEGRDQCQQVLLLRIGTRADDRAARRPQPIQQLIDGRREGMFVRPRGEVDVLEPLELQRPIGVVHHPNQHRVNRAPADADAMKLAPADGRLRVVGRERGDDAGARIERGLEGARPIVAGADAVLEPVDPDLHAGIAQRRGQLEGELALDTAITEEDVLPDGHHRRDYPR